MRLHMVAHAPIWFVQVRHLQPPDAATSRGTAGAHGTVGIWHVCAEVHDVCAAASLASSKDAKGAAALTAIRQGAAPGARLVPARRIRNVPGLAPVARAITYVAIVFR